MNYESNTPIPYGKKCTAANNFREQLANTLRLFGKHTLYGLADQYLRNVREMFTFHMQIRSATNTLS